MYYDLVKLWMWSVIFLLCRDAVVRTDGRYIPAAVNPANSIYTSVILYYNLSHFYS